MIRSLTVACFLAVMASPAQAQKLHMMEARPTAQSVMNGARQEFFVRFDGPVNHHASRLVIERADAVIRTLRPRLGASPNTLYALAGNLPPGAYVLRWVVAPRDGGAPSMGGLDFTIR